MSEPRTLNEFIDRCRAAVTEPDALSSIRALMQRFLAARPDLAAEHPVPTDCTAPSGVSVQLFEDDTLSVQMVHTPPAMEQPPHDHQMSVVIGGIRGVEMHRLYKRTSDGPASIAPSGGKDLASGDILTMGAAGVHAIDARGPEWATALHVYLGRLSTVERSLFHPDTFAEEPLDLARYDEYCRPS